MRKILFSLFSVLVCAVPAFAQMGGGQNYNSGMDELFRANPVFSATMQTVNSVLYNIPEMEAGTMAKQAARRRVRAMDDEESARQASAPGKTSRAASNALIS